MNFVWMKFIVLIFYTSTSDLFDAFQLFFCEWRYVDSPQKIAKWFLGICCCCSLFGQFL